ncbi:uncharacterized protein LOC119681286 [Teleopsis dalmanni]|uniref:uncharacterized protein LOC119681286 n=1 Tax=Teleopsis dalmanni TaxID=139649 RepID=UPI0018CEBF50|nr:uncharacterized protein LOC119681286 [Teleopsis dalmanni]
MSASGSLPRSHASSHSQVAESSEHQSDANDNKRAELHNCDVDTESVPQSAEDNSSIVLTGSQQRYLECEVRRRLAVILQQPLRDNEGGERSAPEGQQKGREMENVPNRSDNQELIFPQDQQNYYEQQGSQDPTSNQGQNNSQNLEFTQERENDRIWSNDQKENSFQVCAICQLPMNAQGERAQTRNQQNNMEGISDPSSDEGISRRERRSRHLRRERIENHTPYHRLNIERIRSMATNIRQGLAEITGANRILRNDLLEFYRILESRRDQATRNVEEQVELSEPNSIAINNNSNTDTQD